MFLLLFHYAFWENTVGWGETQFRQGPYFFRPMEFYSEHLSALAFCPPSPDCSFTEQYSTTVCYGYRLVTESQLCASHGGDKIWDQMNVYMESKILFFFWSATFTTEYILIYTYTLVFHWSKQNTFKNYPRPPANNIRTVNSQKVWDWKWQRHV